MFVWIFGFGYISLKIYLKLFTKNTPKPHWFYHIQTLIDHNILNLIANAGLKQGKHKRQIKEFDNERSKTNREHKTIKANFLAADATIASYH